MKYDFTFQRRETVFILSKEKKRFPFCEDEELLNSFYEDSGFQQS